MSWILKLFNVLRNEYVCIFINDLSIFYNIVFFLNVLLVECCYLINFNIGFIVLKKKIF